MKKILKQPMQRRSKDIEEEVFMNFLKANLPIGIKYGIMMAHISNAQRALWISTMGKSLLDFQIAHIWNIQNALPDQCTMVASDAPLVELLSQIEHEYDNSLNLYILLLYN